MNLHNIIVLFYKTVATLLFTVAFSTCYGDKYQSLDSIYATVKTALAQNVDPALEYDITVLPVDSQLKLPECPKELEIFKFNETIKAGRTSVGVRCNAEKTWSIFISATIKAYANVIVLTRPVQRGELITSQHLGIEKKDISVTRGDYLTRFEQAENKEATRNIPVGAILGLKSVSIPPLVKRKDKVTISSDETAFSVKMTGTALMDGGKDQMIKVKNDSSGRIVSGQVVEPGLVIVK